MRNAANALMALLPAALFLGACTAGPYCDHDSAERALAAAVAGETVELGACEIQGPLRVPPGVQLVGRPGTIVVAPVESGGIIALGGEPATEIRDLTVRVEGRIGILFRGGVNARVTDVVIEANHGIGIGAATLTSLELTRVTLSGPVTSDNADEARWVRVAPAPAPMDACPDPSDCECSPGDLDEPGGQACDASGHWATWTATHGLVLTDVSAAVLADVEVHGFAARGAVLTRSDVTWSGGGVYDTLGIGVRMIESSLSLEDVSADRTHGGLRGDRPYAVMATHRSRIVAERFTVSDNDRYGVLIYQSSGQLVDFVAERNGDVALWVSESDDFELSGTATLLSDNSFAGAVITGSSGVRLSDATVRTTRELERAVGALGLLRVGDGVHINDNLGSVELVDLIVSENARIGVLTDLGPIGPGTASFSMVQVDGSGTQLGAVAGRPSAAGQLVIEAPAGWDTGIVRSGAVVANDAAAAGNIAAITESLPGPTTSPTDILGVVAPMF